MSRCLTLAWAVTCLALPLHAQARTTSESIQAILGDSAEYRHVIMTLQEAIRAHDVPTVASLVQYPIIVTINGKRCAISSPGAFTAKYDSIVTPSIAVAVVGAKYDALMVNYQGVMLGQGEMWVSGVCRDHGCQKAEVRVITIQPAPDGDPAPGT